MNKFLNSMSVGIWESEFYGDIVYKLKKNVGRTDFSVQFRKIIICNKSTCIGYNLNVMRQSACLVFKAITVNSHASLINRTSVCWASDVPDLKLFIYLGGAGAFSSVAWPTGFNW